MALVGEEEGLPAPHSHNDEETEMRGCCYPTHAPASRKKPKHESILSSPTELSPKSTNTNLVWEYLKTGSHWVPAAELGGLKAADDVLQGGSHHKVLLLQAQLLSLEELQKQNSSSTNPDTEAATGPQRPTWTQDGVSG